MKVALVRALLFSATGLVVILIWEVFTFEIPREPISEVWMNRLWFHTFVVIAILIATFGRVVIASVVFI